MNNYEQPEMTSTGVDSSGSACANTNPDAARRYQEKRIAYADALRVIAICAVVVSHLNSLAEISIMGHAFTWLGVLGVDCFFVLSGFLLSQRFLEAFLGRKQFPSLKNYFLRRFFRIYPQYFFALISSIVVATVSGGVPTIGDCIAHLALLQGLFPQYVGAINSPLWTMSVDAEFYVALPLVALAACRLGKHLSETQRFRAAWQGLGLIVIMSIAERMLVLSVPHLHHLGVLPETVYLRNVVGVGGDFAMGAGLSLVSLQNPNPTASKPWSIVVSLLCFLSFVVVARAALRQANDGARADFRGNWFSGVAFVR